MILWTGWGILVVVIFVLCFFGIGIATMAIFNDVSYYDTHGWPKLAAFFISGTIVWVFGTYLNKPKAKIDKETGQEVLTRPNHALSFIRMEYWGPILYILGVINYFVRYL